MSTSLEHGASSCCGDREGHCAAFMGVKEALDGGVGILDALHTAWKLVEAIAQLTYHAK